VQLTDKIGFWFRKINNIPIEKENLKICSIMLTVATFFMDFSPVKVPRKVSVIPTSGYKKIDINNG
jgi:hypothetical protein